MAFIICQVREAMNRRQIQKNGSKRLRKPKLLVIEHQNKKPMAFYFEASIRHVNLIALARTLIL